MTQADIGLIGLAVMGQSLVLNMERNHFTVAVYNRTTSRTQSFVEKHPDKNIVPGTTLEGFVGSLKTPRRILLMVKSTAVDAVLDQLKPLLSPGDIVMDGGNSYYEDTEKRAAKLALEETGIHYMGVGVSGGEEGALWGPSIMPGGPQEAWEAVRPILEAIAAKADDGTPCVSLLGSGGSGHAVKTIHNGAEYGVMALIAEAYALLTGPLGLTSAEAGDLFDEWNRGELESFLVEITALVLKTTDQETGRPLVELVVDSAKTKGTGPWTAQMAMGVGSPVPTINAAVVSRFLSALRPIRLRLARQLPAEALPAAAFTAEDVRAALYASVLATYAQAMDMLRLLSEQRGWDLDLSGVAALWRKGCIIRARFLDDISAAFRQTPVADNLLVSEAFKDAFIERIPSLRRVVVAGASSGIPLPAYSASLGYYDEVRSARLPANLVQGLRDCFGAHTYERTDKPGVFHSKWTGE
eukprot:gnl/Dysnectes_brevis/673_a742_3508.p1 GENE.gnl/Dysnectes_brevis/673_a742_3508~~gnl/Dysnectes_brevis/673_a742_3508.p1  ORF type:complete len:469 (+),score=191.07 gnl/Dysnectes_brevis/673_a742_3508:87-1493(+)